MDLSRVKSRLQQLQEEAERAKKEPVPPIEEAPRIPSKTSNIDPGSTIRGQDVPFYEKAAEAMKYISPVEATRRTLLSILGRPQAAVMSSAVEAAKPDRGFGDIGLAGIKGLVTGESGTASDVVRELGMTPPEGVKGKLLDIAGSLATDPLMYVGGVLKGKGQLSKILGTAKKGQELKVGSAAFDAMAEEARASAERLGAMREVPSGAVVKSGNLADRINSRLRVMNEVSPESERIKEQLLAKSAEAKARGRMAQESPEAFRTSEEVMHKSQLELLQKAQEETGISVDKLDPDRIAAIGEELGFISRMVGEGAVKKSSGVELVSSLLQGKEMPAPKAITGKIGLSTGLARYSHELGAEQLRSVEASRLAEGRRQLGLDAVAESKLSEGYGIGSQSNYAEAVQRRTGVPVGHLPTMGAENYILRKNSLDPLILAKGELEETVAKLGISDTRRTELLEGAVPATIEETKVLEVERSIYERARKLIVESGEDIGYLDDYAPNMLIGNIKGVPKPWKKQAKVPGKESILQERGKVGIAQELRSMSASENITRYLSTVDSVLTKPVVKEYLNRINQLKLLGHEKEAQKILDSLVHATGYGKPAAQSLIGAALMKEGKLNVEEVMRILKETKALPESKFDSALKSLTQYVYESFVGLNPRVHLQQKLQNLVVGVAELGRDWIQFGNRAYRKLTPIERDLVASKLTVVGDAPDILEISRAVGVPPKKGKVSTAMHWLGEKGLKRFGKTDAENRVKVYLGAKAKFDDAIVKNAVESALEGLSAVEKDRVVRALREGGRELAGEVYSKIMVNRIHFSYSAFETPEAMRGIVGKLIPFTSWTRNNWERYLQDVRQGDYEKLLRRVAIPFAYSYALQVVSGVEVPGLNTVGALAGVGNIQPQPVVQDVTRQLISGKPDKAIATLAGILPPVAVAQRLIKGVKDPIKGAGLRRTKLPSIGGALAGRLEQMLGEKTAATKKDTDKLRKDIRKRMGK